MCARRGSLLEASHLGTGELEHVRKATETQAMTSVILGLPSDQRHFLNMVRLEASKLNRKQHCGQDPRVSRHTACARWKTTCEGQSDLAQPPKWTVA